jgi:hypothetical protein
MTLMTSWKSIVLAFSAALLLTCATWSQTNQPQVPTGSDRTAIGFQVQDQPQSPQPTQDQAKPDQPKAEPPKVDQPKPDQPQSGASQPPAEPKVISPKEAKQLFRSVDEILDFASNDTGLPINREVKRKLADRKEVESYLEKGMKDDKDAKRLERSSVVLKKFGLLPRDFQLGPFLVAMLKEQVAGYYDPKKKTVNLLNWVDAEQQKPVLAHELTHALQDQSFSMEKWMKAAETEGEKKNNPTPADIDSDEESEAREAVVEGQAMVVMMDYALAPSGKTLLEMSQIGDSLKQGMLEGPPDSPTFRDAPIFLKEELTFPYRYGMDFTLALEKAGGKELAFAGAFKDPPKTTREIMEPETYLSREKLDPVKRLDFKKDFAGYDTFDIGAIGEFDVDVLVEQYAGRKEAEAMYPAWRGGYYFAGRVKGEKSVPIAVMYVSRWATPDKASEFAAIYAKSLSKRYQKRQPLAADGKVADDAPPAESWRTLRGRHAWLTEEGPIVIEVRSDAVMISESFDAETTNRVEADFFGDAHEKK